jgi:hypothetical protein
MDCEFIKYEAQGLPDGMSRTIGLFVDHDQNDSECLKNVNDSEDLLDDDAFFKTARAMITLSLIGAFCAGCMVMFEFFCCRVCCAVLLEDLAYLGAVATGGLVYLAYHNPYCDTIQEKAQDVLDETIFGNDTKELYECKFGQGSTYNLCAMLFYLAAMIVLCFSPKPTPLIHQMRK